MKNNSKLLLLFCLSSYSSALFSGEHMEDPSSYESTIDAINKEHDQKVKAIHDDYNEKLQALHEARQREKESLSRKSTTPKGGQARTVSVSLNDGPSIDAHFDKKTDELLRQKSKDLKEAKFQKDDAFRKALLDKIDTSIEAKKRAQETKKSKSAPTTERAKTIIALQDHEKAATSLKRDYDQSLAVLERHHKDEISHLEGLRNNDATYLKTADGKEFEGADKVYEYYTDTINTLNATFEKEKVEYLADYNNSLRDLTAKTNDALDKASVAKEDAALSTELAAATPRSIDDVVDQFSDKVVPSLSATQKGNLREILSTVKQEVGNGVSIETVVQRNKKDFVQKLQLDEKQSLQLDTFLKGERNSLPDKKQGLFDALLEFFRALFSNKPAKNIPSRG